MKEKPILPYSKKALMPFVLDTVTGEYIDTHTGEMVPFLEYMEWARSRDPDLDLPGDDGVLPNRRSLDDIENDLKTACNEMAAWVYFGGNPEAQVNPDVEIGDTVVDAAKMSAEIEHKVHPIFTEKVEVPGSFIGANFFWTLARLVKLVCKLMTGAETVSSMWPTVLIDFTSIMDMIDHNIVPIIMNETFGHGSISYLLSQIGVNKAQISRKMDLQKKLFRMEIDKLRQKVKNLTRKLYARDHGKSNPIRTKK